MEFLFHTVIEFDGVAVYYNIYQDKDQYYARILDNPYGVKEAKDFKLKMVNNNWQCSEKMPTRVVEVAGEAIDRFLM